MAPRTARALSGLMTALMLAACAPEPAPADAGLWPEVFRRDLYPEWITLKPDIRWPPNDGCAAAPTPQVLPAGALIDRFGSENGQFFSPKGEPYAARAVPYVCERMAYTVYRVVKPLAVKACMAAPWFGEPGGATQYQSADPAARLREAGLIEVVDGGAGGTTTTASPCPAH